MANLKDIRNRIKSVKSIQKVTKAMKMVAVAKMRRAQERMEEARPYAKRLAEVINHLLPDVDRNFLPLLDIREIKRVGLFGRGWYLWQARGGEQDGAASLCHA